MKQVVILHGGTSYSSYENYLGDLKAKQIDYDRLKLKQRWSNWISGQMPDVDVLLPELPNRNNAVFEEWKIYFEKLIPFFGDDVRLVGHSLGAMFLAKYLQDNPLVHKVKQVILIAPCYNDDSLEDLGSFEVISASELPDSAANIHLIHSQDDPIVPFNELAKFQADLPDATTHIFEDHGHFLDPTFPELLELLQQK